MPPRRNAHYYTPSTHHDEYIPPQSSQRARQDLYALPNNQTQQGVFYVWNPLLGGWVTVFPPLEYSLMHRQYQQVGSSQHAYFQEPEQREIPTSHNVQNFESQIGIRQEISSSHQEMQQLQQQINMNSSSISDNTSENFDPGELPLEEIMRGYQQPEELRDPVIEEIMNELSAGELSLEQHYIPMDGSAL